MVYYILGFIICLIIYVLLYPIGNGSVTSTTIRDLWSGNCQLACRRHLRPQVRTLWDELKQQASSIQNTLAESLSLPAVQPAPRQEECVCESCLCGLIESVVRSCPPAANWYSDMVVTLGSFIYAIIIVVSDMMTCLSHLIYGTLTPQRETKIVDPTRTDSANNITFSKESADDDASHQSIPRIMPDSKLVPQRVIPPQVPLQIRSKQNLQEPSGSKSPIQSVIEQRVSVDSIKKLWQPESTVKKVCKKCKENNKVCVDQCPARFNQ